MHLAVTVWFQAQHGGLHEYVVSQVVAAIRNEWRVSVVCKDGEFLRERLSDFEINKVPVDFEDAESRDAASGHLTSADIIHAHPGPSREMALAAAALSGRPVVLTVHGQWTDSVHRYHDRLCRIICVSQAVADTVRGQQPTLEN